MLLLDFIKFVESDDYKIKSQKDFILLNTNLTYLKYFSLLNPNISFFSTILQYFLYNGCFIFFNNQLFSIYSNNIFFFNSLKLSFTFI